LTFDLTRVVKTLMERAASRPVITNLPNMLTYARILAVPALVACFFLSDSNNSRWLAFAIFTAAGITDFFDGYLARVWQQQSSLGAMLDPIADKLLVGATLMVLVADQTISGWALLAAIIILSREILVSGLREFLADLDVSVPVTQLAKFKTTAQMIALGFLIVGPAGEWVFPWTMTTGLTLLWVSAIITLYTGYDYLKASFDHVIDQGE